MHNATLARKLWDYTRDPSNSREALDLRSRSIHQFDLGESIFVERYYWIKDEKKSLLHVAAKNLAVRLFSILDLERDQGIEDD